MFLKMQLGFTTPYVLLIINIILFVETIKPVQLFT